MYYLFKDSCLMEFNSFSDSNHLTSVLIEMVCLWHLQIIACQGFPSFLPNKTGQTSSSCPIKGSWSSHSNHLLHLISSLFQWTTVDSYINTSQLEKKSIFSPVFRLVFFKHQPILSWLEELLKPKLADINIRTCDLKGLAWVLRILPNSQVMPMLHVPHVENFLIRCYFSAYNMKLRLIISHESRLIKFQMTSQQNRWHFDTPSVDLCTLSWIALWMAAVSCSLIIMAVTD